MKNFLLQFFTWWNGQTLGTRFHTWRFGERVGEDDLDNIYYRGGKDIDGAERRWVIFADYAEASAVPPGWHGWLHHRVDTPPTDEDYKRREWEIDHLPNLTGSSAAYRPKGSMLRPESRPQVTGDYDAWTPGA